MIRRIEPDQGNNALKTVAYLSDPENTGRRYWLNHEDVELFIKGIISIMVALYLTLRKIEELKNGMRRPL